MLVMTLLIADRSVGAEGDVPPKLLSTAIPEYPRAAYETGREGTVILELVIDAEGRVMDARVTKSIPEFDGAALACVSQWRFIPAQQRGRPVSAKATALVIFKRPSKARPTTARGEVPTTGATSSNA
jgi:TonB family protein